MVEVRADFTERAEEAPLIALVVEAEHVHWLVEVLVAGER